jgi:hypothetical protein
MHNLVVCGASEPSGAGALDQLAVVRHRTLSVSL